MNKVTSWLLLHIHIYDFILWIKLRVSLYYIYIHMIWFYEYSYQFASTIWTNKLFVLINKVTCLLVQHIHAGGLILQIQWPVFFCKRTYNSTLKMNLPVSFFFIYIPVQMIWFYEESNHFASTTYTYILFDFKNKITNLLLLHKHT